MAGSVYLHDIPTTLRIPVALWNTCAVWWIVWEPSLKYSTSLSNWGFAPKPKLQNKLQNWELERVPQPGLWPTLAHWICGNFAHRLALFLANASPKLTRHEAKRTNNYSVPYTDGNRDSQALMKYEIWSTLSIFFVCFFLCVFLLSIGIV